MPRGPDSPPTPITRVSIEEGCISCQLCQDMVPEVFRVDDGQDCVIRDGAREWFEARAEAIREAAEDCPVEVIKVEHAGRNGS
jgi:ferredoxin